MPSAMSSYANLNGEDILKGHSEDQAKNHLKKKIDSTYWQPWMIRHNLTLQTLVPEPVN